MAAELGAAFHAVGKGELSSLTSHSRSTASETGLGAARAGRPCRRGQLVTSCSTWRTAAASSSMKFFGAGLSPRGKQPRSYAPTPPRRGRGNTGSRRLRTCSMQADDLPPPSEMTYESALELLGVQDGATFDDILLAKKRRLASVGEDQELMIRVEAAYDILLMQSLSRRRAGQVVESVKYADVRKPKPAGGASPSWVNALRRTTTLTVAKPDSKDLATKAAVFGVLAAWTYAGGLGAGDAYSQYGSPAAGSDVPGLQLALGVGASVYFLRKDNVGLGRAMALTFAALTFGGLTGGFLEGWLRVDIFPLLGISSPAVLIGEFSTIFLCLACLFLR